MPLVQDEHSSEHSQAFQGLLISDSPDDKADESLKRSLLRHSGHRSSGTGQTGNRSDHEHSVHQSRSARSDAVDHRSMLLNRTLQEHWSELEHGLASNRTRHHSDVSRSSQRDSSTHRAAIPLRHADPMNTLRLRCSGIVVSGAILALMTLSLRDIKVVPPLVQEGRRRSYIRRGNTLPLLVLLLAAPPPLLLEKEQGNGTFSLNEHTSLRSSKRDKRAKKHKRKRSPISIFFFVFFSFLQTLLLLSREVQPGRSLEIVPDHFLRLMRILMIPLIGLSVWLCPGTTLVCMLMMMMMNLISTLRIIRT